MSREPARTPVYDDLPAPDEMAADCRAATANLRLRAPRQVPAAPAGRSVRSPGLFPVSDATARLAGRLHLHLH